MTWDRSLISSPVAGGGRRFLQIRLMFRRHIGRAGVLAPLQRAQVTDDRPTIVHRDARSIGHHGVFAVRDGVENFAVRHVAEAIVLQRDDGRQAVLFHDPVTGRRGPWQTAQLILKRCSPRCISAGVTSSGIPVPQFAPILPVLK